jgi:anti-sigma factor RsiW
MTDPTATVGERELADLAALADGTLPAGRRAAVEARVAASPELQALLERQRRALAATSGLTDEPVPAHVEAAVRGARPARRTWRPAWIGAAAAVAATVAVVAAIALTGGPGGPSVAEAARFAAQPVAGSAAMSSGDGATLDVAVDGVAFPDLSDYGWQAGAVRSGTVAGRDATVVTYHRDGQRLAYAVVAGDGLDRPAGTSNATVDGVRFQTLTVGGRTVTTWRRLGHTCVLIGDATPAEQLALASWRGDGALRY